MLPERVKYRICDKRCNSHSSLQDSEFRRNEQHYINKKNVIIKISIVRGHTTRLCGLDKD